MTEQSALKAFSNYWLIRLKLSPRRFQELLTTKYLIIAVVKAFSTVGASLGTRWLTNWITALGLGPYYISKSCVIFAKSTMTIFSNSCLGFFYTRKAYFPSILTSGK